MKKKFILITAVILVATGLATLSFAAESKGISAGVAEAENNDMTSVSQGVFQNESEADVNIDRISVDIVYNAANGYTYITDGLNGTITPVRTEDTESEADSVDVELMSQAEDKTFTYGDMTATAVSKDGSMLAASLAPMNPSGQGRVILFECGTDGTLKFIGMAPTGVQPDMVTFSEDDSLILTADRGEQRMERGKEGNLKGSVTIADISQMRCLWANCQEEPRQDTVEGYEGSSVIIDFSGFSDGSLLSDAAAKGMLQEKGLESPEGFEPERITIAGSYAYILFPEKSKVFVIDLTDKKILKVHSLDTLKKDSQEKR